MSQPEITGQIIFRDTNGIKARPGKKLMLVVGVVEVPKNFICQGEHQYVVEGEMNPESTKLLIHNEGKDRSKEIGSKDADSILLTPIWQV